MNIENSGCSEIYLFRAFMLVMRERSVSRTADELGVSQPAMSRMLGKMRELFNDPLLIRSRSAMVPTQRALELEKPVQSLIDRFDTLLAPSDKFDASRSHRTFTISLPEFAERFVVPSLLQKLRREALNRPGF